MPLTVTIDLNGRTLEQYHIGRIDGGAHSDDVNTYSVVTGRKPLWTVTTQDWYSGVTFTHRYGDGAAECVRKALEAVR